MEQLKRLIADVPDFPTPGILFRDITPLLLEPAALDAVVSQFAEIFGDREVDRIAAIESRGFILGAPLALALGCGFIPIRKIGKLPRATISREYSLEYGTNHLEMHADAVETGQRVLVLDDVLATGGTARAAVDLIRDLGGEIAGVGFLLEIGFLNGREKLSGEDVHALLTY